MPLYACAFPNCKELGTRDVPCYLCQKRFCAKHFSEPTRHDCPTHEDDEEAYRTRRAHSLQDELSATFASFDKSALEQRASELRDGVSCFVQPLSLTGDQELSMNAMYVHIAVIFEDGIEWICRIRRRNASTPPVALLDQVVSREAATLKFLSSIGLPVPRVYEVVLPSKPNAIGVGYLLMEKLKGQPMMDFSSMDVHSKTKVLEQFADIFITLSRHSFPLIGCLQDQEGSVVGPVVSEDAADFEKGNLDLLGPFGSAAEYYNSIVQRYIEHIIRKESHPENSVDAYIVHRQVLDIIPLLNPQRSPPSFYLKHMYDAGYHILLDDEKNITGIIDWEWAQTLPKEDAFSAPSFLIDVAAYHEGNDALSNDEELFASILEKKGGVELAGFVRRGRIWHRLAHSIAPGTYHKELPVHFSRLWAGTQGVEQSWEDWKVAMLKKLKNDPDLVVLLKGDE